MRVIRFAWYAIVAYVEKNFETTTETRSQLASFVCRALYIAYESVDYRVKSVIANQEYEK